MESATINDRKYGRLLAATLPRVIADDEEFDRAVEILENMHFPERRLSPEEEALAGLLQKLIQEYDDKIELPPSG